MYGLAAHRKNEHKGDFFQKKWYVEGVQKKVHKRFTSYHKNDWS